MPRGEAVRALIGRVKIWVPLRNEIRLPRKPPAVPLRVRKHHDRGVPRNCWYGIAFGCLSCLARRGLRTWFLGRLHGLRDRDTWNKQTQQDQRPPVRSPPQPPFLLRSPRPFHRSSSVAG